MSTDILDGAEWDVELDRLEPAVRGPALDRLARRATEEREAAPTATKPGNLHAHTFHSFNCYNYSPARYALLARRFGMEVAGIVDFDVLDGLDEFHAAGRQLGLRTVVSLETRVYVPEFATSVINSPGEPGVAYHMACGFAHPPTARLPAAFLKDLRERSEHRNRDVVARVNAVLGAVALDYATDVRPLTPGGNATERHLVLAYARKAARLIGPEGLLAFWSTKLGPGLSAEDLPESPKLLNLIRAKLMKSGGPGYVAPTPETFPPLADFNQFALQSGAIPTVAWLDGTSPVEGKMAHWCAVAALSGAAALNIIPDRNFTPGKPDAKRQHLHDVVALAERLNWPVIAGTEMNSYGQKFVDAFDDEALRPLVPTFRRGAFVLYAHTALQRAAGIGYLGPWAEQHLPRREDRLAWFAALGAALTPETEAKLTGLTPDETPDAIRRRL